MARFPESKVQDDKATALQYFPDKKIMQFIEHLCFPSEVQIQVSLLEVDFLSSEGKHSYQTVILSCGLIASFQEMSVNIRLF